MPKYIVVMKEGTSESEIASAKQGIKDQGGEITHEYDSVLTGFSAEVPDGHITTLQSYDFIDYIEPDQVVTIQ